MRKLVFVLPLLAASCSGNGPDENASGEAAPAAATLYTIRAGPVPNARLGALAGTFQLLETGNPDGIPSDRLGGACLAFAAADLGFTQMAAKQCSKNSDCSTPGENAFGYCDVQTNSCWAKPATPAANPALCQKGQVWAATATHAVPAQPVNAAQFGIKPGAKVRVVACLNKSGITVSATGCASKDGPDRIEVLGPIATVR